MGGTARSENSNGQIAAVAQVRSRVDGLLTLCIPALIWYLIETQGGSLPDAAPHRNAVCLAFFCYFPLVLAIFAIHLAAIFCTARQFAVSFVVSFCAGSLGMGLLILAIVTSFDGDAGMALLAIPIAFSAFAVIWFIVAAAVLVITGRCRGP